MAAALAKKVNITRSVTYLKQSYFPCSNKIIVSKKPEDTVTHTGQKWEEDDYRMVRFIDRPKQVNQQFAIDLVNAIPPKPVKDRVTFCDGGGGALGHPKVYINLDKPGAHICGYCGLRFVLEDDHHH